MQENNDQKQHIYKQIQHISSPIQTVGKINKQTSAIRPTELEDNLDKWKVRINKYNTYHHQYKRSDKQTNTTHIITNTNGQINKQIQHISSPIQTVR